MAESLRTHCHKCVTWEAYLWPWGLKSSAVSPLPLDRVHPQPSQTLQPTLGPQPPTPSPPRPVPPAPWVLFADVPQNPQWRKRERKREIAVGASWTRPTCSPTATGQVRRGLNHEKENQGLWANICKTVSTPCKGLKEIILCWSFRGPVVHAKL